MSDTMTLPEAKGENALSDAAGTDALAALRGKAEPETEQEEAEEETPEAESEESVEASAEAEAEDTEDGETDENDESSEADDGESESEEEESVTITLKDGSEITAEEAAKGYLRESDYTRKMQTGQKELKDQKAKHDAEHTEAMKALGGLYQKLSEFVPQEPDWEARIDEVGADQAMKEQTAWRKRDKALDAARSNIINEQQKQINKATEEAAEILSSGELIPEWSDEKALNEGISRIEADVTSKGYDINLVANLPDGKVKAFAISLLEKARRYDELQASKTEVKKAVKKKPKPLKPGSKNQVQKATDRSKQAAVNRFRQTKTQEDGLAALGALRKAAGG